MLGPTCFFKLPNINDRCYETFWIGTNSIKPGCFNNWLNGCFWISVVDSIVYPCGYYYDYGFEGEDCLVLRVGDDGTFNIYV